MMGDGTHHQPVDEVFKQYSVRKTLETQEVGYIKSAMKFVVY